MKNKKVKLKNRIAIILDSSSSMASMKNEVIDGFNNQIKAILKNNKNMDTKVSLITFADRVNPFIIYNEDVKTLKLLTEKDYNPSGWTALYDAIGAVVQNFSLLPESEDENCSFFLFVVTDGQENQSKLWNFQKISDKIKEVEATKRWTITYLGAAEGLKDVGTNLGLFSGNTISGTALRGGVMYDSYATTAVTNFMSARSIGQTMTTNAFDGTLTIKKENENENK